MNIPLSIEFEPAGPTEGSFSLGHMRIGGNEQVSSETAGSRGLMMIYVSAALLLQQLMPLITGQSDQVSFGGVGSSFEVSFSRRKKLIRIRAGNLDLGRYTSIEVGRACSSGAKDLLGRHPLSSSESVFHDLVDSINAMQSAIPD
jgi:hypothetical protein